MATSPAAGARPSIRRTISSRSRRSSREEAVPPGKPKGCKAAIACSSPSRSAVAPSGAGADTLPHDQDGEAACRWKGLTTRRAPIGGLLGLISAVALVTLGPTVWERALLHPAGSAALAVRDPGAPG